MGPKTLFSLLRPLHHGAGELSRTQRVHVYYYYGIRSQKPSLLWFWGPSSIIVVYIYIYIYIYIYYVYIYIYMDPLSVDVCMGVPEN